MSKPIIEARTFRGGGMDSDTALDSILQPDYVEAFCFETTGNVEGEDGDGTNIASTVVVPGYNLPAGINKCMGAEKFETQRKAYFIIYNSFGYHQLGEFDPDLNITTLLFTNLTDSAGVDVLPITSKNYIRSFKLVDGVKLCFTDGNIEVGDISIPRLKSGGYGVVTIDDIRLIKAQPIKIPTSVYGNDAGRVVNSLKEKLFQFRNEFIYLDDEPSTFSSISKRNVPVKESTTGVGEDVTKNNHMVVTVDIGTNRVKEIDIAARYSLYDWFIVKSVSRDYVLSLPSATVDVNQEIYESYNPTANTYSFAFYNDGSYVNIDPVETDQEYDHVPQKVEDIELVNGNIYALGGITEGYPRPIIDVNLTVSNYSPQFDSGPVVAGNLKIRSTQNDRKKASHARDITVTFSGTAKTGDKIHLTSVDIRDANAKRDYEYIVDVMYNNDTLGALRYMAANKMPNVAVNAYAENDYFVMKWVDFQYYELRNAYIELASVGSGVFSSIHALKTNSAYQAALQYYDRYGRTFPLITGNNFIFKTDSYAQTKGLTPALSWQIFSDPPVGAVSYQWLLSENTTHQNVLDVNGKYLRVEGNDIVLSINPLKVFNTRNSSSILNYEYSTGDRVTFYYYDNAGTKVWFDNPFIDVQVTGFDIKTDTAPDPDTITYELKVRLNSSINIANITNKNILMEIYTPKKRVVVNGDTTTYLANLFFEVGEQYNITNGKHDVVSGVITEGDGYYKTRDMVSALDENTYITFLVEDFNFSDLYESKYTSYGRGFLYNERDGVKVRKAGIRYSDTFTIDSKVNKLNRFYAERLFGDGDGETSSIYGWIRKLRQRGNYMVCLQETNSCHIPLFSTIVEDQSGQEQAFLSDKLFNKVRYSQVGIYGMGNSPETYCESPNGTMYFHDPNNSIPMREGYNGLMPIAQKMEKFFKRTIHKNKQMGRDTIAYWNDYLKAAVFSTQVISDGVVQVPVVDSSFIYQDDFNVIPANITIVDSPTKGNISYASGQWVYTPNNNAIGSDSFTFSFVVNGATIVKRACMEITAGNSDVNQFTFIDLTEQPLSTVVESNMILVTGNDIGSPISITGGEYRINGGPWVSTNGTVNNGDAVTVRLTTAPVGNTTRSAVLTIGSQSDSFDAKTVTVYYNVAKTQNFTRNNCSVDQTGTSVPYTVPAGTYSSMVSQADADAQAQANIDANGQSFANANGSCNFNPTVPITIRTIYGTNPLTWNGAVFYKNGVETDRVEHETSGVMTLPSTYRVGDTIRIVMIHYFDVFPWAPSSKGNLSVLRNGSSIYNADNNDPNVVGLHDTTYTIAAGTTSLSIVATGSSTATGYTTKTLSSTNNCNAEGDLGVEIRDNSTGVFIFKGFPQRSTSGANTYPFNFLTNAAQMTYIITNNSGTTMNYSLTGDFSYSSSGTIPAGGNVTLTNVPKGSQALLTSN